MLAFRSFARVLPRATFRISPVAARASQRYLAVSKPSSSILTRATPYKAFSTTRMWREPAGDSDAELSAKLDAEYQIEEKPALPQELEDFLADSKFQIEDAEGTENVVLTKKFGNETVKIECSIADLMGDREMDDLEDDEALLDEVDEDVTSGGKRTINQTKGGKIDVMPEDSIAPSDREMDEDALSPESIYPINLNITIDKGASGATNVTARIEDGDINIDYVHFYAKGDLIDPKTYEQTREALNGYGGPPFANLDYELQQIYQNYIEERGINAQLAQFLPRYLDYKEQREYVKWLQDLKKFVDA